MSNQITSLKDLCLDNELEFTLTTSLGDDLYEITPDVNSLTSFNKLKNGSYIIFHNSLNTKKGLAMYGVQNGTKLIKVLQSNTSVAVNDVLLTKSQYNKTYDFCEEYQTLNDINNYFASPTDVDNNVTVKLDNTPGLITDVKEVIIKTPYNSRHTLISPTESSKLSKLPFIISLSQDLLLTANTKTPVFFIQKSDITRKVRKFSVYGSTDVGSVFDFDIVISPDTTSTDDYVSVYSRPKNFEFDLIIDVRKSLNDDVEYYRVSFQTASNETLKELNILTPYPNQIKYWFTQYNNYTVQLNFIRDKINVNPRFLMADTDGNYIDTMDSADLSDVMQSLTEIKKHKWNITVTDFNNIYASSSSDIQKAVIGQTVTITTVRGSNVYYISSITAVTDGGDSVPLTNTGPNTYTFDMPFDNVNVSVNWGHNEDI